MANQSVQVSCRVRDAAEPGATPALSVDPEQRALVVRHPPSGGSETSFSCFDFVFPGSASQETLFERVGQPFVDDVLLGYDCTVLAYGQTGSGKTYTTVGGPDARGLVPRAMEQLFAGAARVDREQFDVTLTASFVEVYQETLRDLLAPPHTGSGSPPLRIREDKGERGVFVDGASEILLSSVASGMAVLASGAAHRATGATLMNADSSRSHSVFALTFTRRSAATRETVRGRLLFVDLAGSEKASKTAASGKRLDEAKHINRSLSALGNVINALTDGGASATRFVPYRDSKLTRLLQSSLGGSAKTHLLLTCSSSALHAAETLSTLRFGARATRIENAPRVNSDKPTSAAEYKELVGTLQTKLESLCRYIRRLESVTRQEPRTHSPESNAEAPRESASPATRSAQHTDADESSDGGRRLLDALMQEEVNSLRRAVAQLQSGRHEAEHAQLLADAMAQISRREHDTLCQAQLGRISALEAELADAHIEIGSLRRELAREQDERRRADAACEDLRAEAKRLKLQQRRRDDEQSAEAEILRRQLHSLERLARQSQEELRASERQQDDLKARVVAKEQELSRLSAEITAPALCPSVASSGSPPGERRSLPRPFTAAAELGASDSSVSSGMGNITSWWAGSPAQRSPERDWGARRLDSSECSQHAQLPSERRRANSTPLAGVAGAGEGSSASPPLVVFPHAAVSAGNKRQEERCRSQGQSRPFRARLVGLLNSLEEETSSLKELVSETKRDAGHRPQAARAAGGDGGGGSGATSRQPRHLPCLES